MRPFLNKNLGWGGVRIDIIAQPREIPRNFQRVKYWRLTQILWAAGQSFERFRNLLQKQALSGHKKWESALSSHKKWESIELDKGIKPNQRVSTSWKLKNGQKFSTRWKNLKDELKSRK